MIRNTRNENLSKVIIFLLISIGLFSIALLIGFTSSRKTSQLKTKAEDITENQSGANLENKPESFFNKIKIRIAYENDSGIKDRNNVFNVTQIKYRMNNRTPYKLYSPININSIKSESGRVYAENDVIIPMDAEDIVQYADAVSVWVIGSTRTDKDSNPKNQDEIRTCSSYQTDVKRNNTVDLGDLIFRYNGVECQRHDDNTYGLIPDFTPKTLMDLSFSVPNIIQSLEKNEYTRLYIWHITKDTTTIRDLRYFFYMPSRQKFVYRIGDGNFLPAADLPDWISDLEDYKLAKKDDLIILSIEEGLTSSLAQYKSVIIPLTLGYRIRNNPTSLPDLKSTQMDIFPQTYEVSKEDLAVYLQSIIDIIGNQFIFAPEFLNPIRSFPY